MTDRDEPASTPEERRGATPGRPGPGYGPVLVLLIVFPVIGVLSSLAIGTLVGALLTVGLWLAIARATGMSTLAERGGLAAAASLAAVGAVAVVLDRNGLLAAVEIATAAAIAASAAVIGRALMRDRLVTLSTVAGVLSLYLMIGLFFASCYQGSLRLSEGAFASSFTPLDRFDLLYFSFVTVTTVGFGDITPAIDATRVLAMSEAVIGQLFLVTVVARVVAMLGQTRPGR